MQIIDIIFIAVTGIVLYVSFLFLILFFKNKSKMESVPKYNSLPSVTIIMPAFNEENVVAKAIENLKNLNYPKNLLEILVVNDNSTDKTAEIARTSGARVINNDIKGKANAVNHGIKNAKGEIIIIVDADSFPEKNALMQSIPFFEEKDVMAVTTKIYVKNYQSFLGRLQAIEYALTAWTRKLSEFIDGIYVTPGPFALYRKDIFKKIGYFDPTNATEDIEIAWRILSHGFKIKMSPAKVHTYAPEKWKKWIRQRVRWNIGGFQTTIKYKSFFLKKGPSNFSLYVLPFFSLSYFVTFLSLGLFVYLFYFWIYSNLSFIISAYMAGLDPFKHYIFAFYPDLFLYFSIILLTAAIFIIYVGMKDLNMKQTNWPFIAFYLTFYITIFPFLMLYSMMKYARGYKEW